MGEKEAETHSKICGPHGFSIEPYITFPQLCHDLKS